MTTPEMSPQRQRFARVMTTAFGLFAAMVIGVVVGTVWPLRTQPPAPAHGHTATVSPAVTTTAQTAKAPQVFAYLRGKMPRAGFTGVRPDSTVPGLFHVETASNAKAPVYFDPRNHALIIGLVVNLDNPQALIAPGTRFPAGHIAPQHIVGHMAHGGAAGSTAH